MSFLGFLGKALVGTVGGLITGGPVGAIAGGAAAVLGKGASAGSAGGGVLPASPITRPRVTLGGAFPTMVGQPLTTRNLVATTTIGRTLMAPVGAMPAAPAPTAKPMVQGPDGKVCELKGYHLNKSRYFVNSNHWWQSSDVGTKVEAGEKCVKNRRMNAGNTKALRRALRRAYGFEKLAMRTIRLLHPRKPARFGGFKRARKR